MPSGSVKHSESELFEGGYYSILDVDVYSIAMLLKLEAEFCHVSIYKQHCQGRPRSIDISALTLGSIHDEDGFGMGHLPLKLQTFKDREPLFLTYSEVVPEELEGYQVWKASSDCGVWE